MQPSLCPCPNQLQPHTPLRACETTVTFAGMPLGEWLSYGKPVIEVADDIIEDMFIDLGGEA